MVAPNARNARAATVSKIFGGAQLKLDMTDDALCLCRSGFPNRAARSSRNCFALHKILVLRE
jgi:hypothetical protein